MSLPVKPKKKIVINPTTGTLDLVTDNNFSYESVPENKKLLVSKNMQMTVHEYFEVEGELRLDGSLILEE
jgi:hypothetical protein